MTKRVVAGKGSRSEDCRDAEHGQACTEDRTSAVAVRVALELGRGDEVNRQAEMADLTTCRDSSKCPSYDATRRDRAPYLAISRHLLCDTARALHGAIGSTQPRARVQTNKGLDESCNSATDSRLPKSSDRVSYASTSVIALIDIAHFEVNLLTNLSCVTSHLRHVSSSKRGCAHALIRFTHIDHIAKSKRRRSSCTDAKGPSGSEGGSRATGP
jgi:hypothetical protein